MTKVEDKIDFTETQLREVFTKAGLNSQEINKAVADYIRYRENELSGLSMLSYEDLKAIGSDNLWQNVISKIKDGEELVNTILKDYLLFVKWKKKIADTYQESKSWDKVITTTVYVDQIDSQEAFIDYVEDIYRVKVKDGKHLQKLTGITEETLEGLDETVTGSRYSKYFRSLEKALQDGAKYKDLLQIKPQDYGLPKTWKGCLGSDQYSTILWAISFEFCVNELQPLLLFSDLRSIAQEVEAPYSVLMDCYQLTFLHKKHGVTGN
jgi:hypothetical protein